MKEGFYTALGTPLAEDGRLVPGSLERQIDDQISAGAAGLLLMGTMGRLGNIREDVYEDVIACAADAVKGRTRLMVGITDNSLARIRQKLRVVERYPVESVVLTAPYYFKTGDVGLMNYFSKTAAMTEREVVLYDHVPITKHKITYAMTVELARLPNVKGIKSGDLVLVKALHDAQTGAAASRNELAGGNAAAGEQEVKADFYPVFSGSDLFAASWVYGIRRYLDGIFACFPKSIGTIQRAFDRDDFEAARRGLNVMMAARDDMIALGIWPAFTHAMNLLGYEGDFAPDYELPLDSRARDEVEAIMRRCGEID